MSREPNQDCQKSTQTFSTNSRMASKEELFVSFSPDIYRKGKSNTLMSQGDLLQSLKRIHNLKILARQKHDLKKRLNKLITSTTSEIDSIQDKMPNPKIPKSIHKEEETKEPKKTFSRRDDIEDELKLIQEKLRELNS